METGGRYKTILTRYAVNTTYLPIISAIFNHLEVEHEKDNVQKVAVTGIVHSVLRMAQHPFLKLAFQIKLLPLFSSEH